MKSGSNKKSERIARPRAKTGSSLSEAWEIIDSYRGIVIALLDEPENLFKYFTKEELMQIQSNIEDIL